MLRIAAPLPHLAPGRRRGSVLITVLVLGLLLATIVAALLATSTQESVTRNRYETYKDEFAAAEVALNKAYAQVQFHINFGAADLQQEMATLTPPVVRNYEFTHFTAEQTFAGLEEVDDGQWEGLTLHRMHYRIEVTARKHSAGADRLTHPGVSLNQNLEITYVPLFLFAIFYDPVMEIAPGPFMQVNGRVHANGDAYFQSGAGLDFLAPVTIAGRVRYGRHAESGEAGAGGDVRFTRDGSLLSMRRAGDPDGWLTSTDADWATAAQARWGSGLRDQSHGVNPLSLPIPNTIDPHAIIERADPANDSPSLQQEKFEYKAGLKIEVRPNGTLRATNAAGNVVPLSYPNPSNPSQTKQIATQTTFFDARENKTVRSIDINMGNLRESGISPGNGIVYVANERSGGSLNVVRLQNAARLPSSVSGGFTLASSNPVYLQGNYNTVNKTLAMVAADALTILSNNWLDSRATNYSQRTGTATEINAVCLQGTVPTEDGNYSGGVENYFRFLEQWNNADLRFSGSIINMWDSQMALAHWRYGSPVYTAPTRRWSGDTARGGINGPPGAPRVVEISKTGWAMSGGD